MIIFSQWANYPCASNGVSYVEREPQCLGVGHFHLGSVPPFLSIHLGLALYPCSLNYLLYCMYIILCIGRWCAFPACPVLAGSYYSCQLAVGGGVPRGNRWQRREMLIADVWLQKEFHFSFSIILCLMLYVVQYSYVCMHACVSEWASDVLVCYVGRICVAMCMACCE